MFLVLFYVPQNVRSLKMFRIVCSHVDRQFYNFDVGLVLQRSFLIQQTCSHCLFLDRQKLRTEFLEWDMSCIVVKSKVNLIPVAIDLRIFCLDFKVIEDCCNCLSSLRQILVERNLFNNNSIRPDHIHIDVDQVNLRIIDIHTFVVWIFFKKLPKYMWEWTMLIHSKVELRR